VVSDDSLVDNAANGSQVDWVSENVTITLTGTNDAPALTVDSQGTVTEDADSSDLTVSGALSFIDEDSNDSHQVTVSYNDDATWSDGTSDHTLPDDVSALTSGFSADLDGWDYNVANSDVQFLKAGETVTLSYDVTVADSSSTATEDSNTETVTITIEGTNDQPVIEATSDRATTSYNGASYDVDATAPFTYIDISGIAQAFNYVPDTQGNDPDFPSDDSQTTALPIGFGFDYWGQNVNEFFISSNGYIGFDSDDDYGDNYGFSFPTNTLSLNNLISIVGTDLDPEEGGTIQYATVGEEGNRVLVVEYDAVPFYENKDVTVSAQIQLFEATNQIELHILEADGITNDDSSNTQGLLGPDGISAIVVPGRDNELWSASEDAVRFTPKQVAPEVFGADVSEGDVGDTVSTSGILNISDVDSNDSPVFDDQRTDPRTGPTYGEFVLENNVWTYTVDQSAVQHLDEGDQVDDSITYTATDGTQQVITVTIAGTNDVPTLTGHTGTVTEDGGALNVATGTLSFNDLDADDTQTFSVANPTGTYGSLAINELTGAWTYTLNNADGDTDALVQDATDTDTIEVTMTDGLDQSTVADVVITVTGTNDDPVITSAVTAAQGTVSENATTATATGTLTASDVDTGHTLTYSVDNSQGTYGSLAVDSATGVWTYTLDNNDADTDALAAEASVTDTITVTVTDDQGATATQDVTVTITGANDGPEITSAAGDAEGAVTEDAVTATANGTLTASDVDAGHTLTYSIDNNQGTYGSLAVDSQKKNNKQKNNQKTKIDKIQKNLKPNTPLKNTNPQPKKIKYNPKKTKIK
jgi:VCBS repeat-containing protein